MNFERGVKNIYTNEEKLQLAKLFDKDKLEDDAGVKNNEETKNDFKRKNHVPVKTLRSIFLGLFVNFIPI